MSECLEVADLPRLVRRLASLSASTDAECIDGIAALERLKSAAAAAQARLTAEFATSQRSALDASGNRSADPRSIGAQIALARRESPYRGGRHVGLAEALVHEMPQALAALEQGETTEWRVTLVAKETACLVKADRSAVDAELAARTGGYGTMGDARTADEARRAAYRIDPAAAARRCSKAESERRVTLRPAPDTMTHLTGLLPVARGVAAFASLTRATDAMKARGDDRTRSQIMADLMARRLSDPVAAAAELVDNDPTRWDGPGWNSQPESSASRRQEPPAAGATTPTENDFDEGSAATNRSACGACGCHDGGAIDLQLVMTDSSLFGEDDEPAQVSGFGPVLAFLARRLVREAPDAATVWLRRLYTDRGGGLVAMDARGRLFRGGMRRFVITRDQWCRTPWCGARIRHVDHVRRAVDGGESSTGNGQGLCEACNYVKESRGWSAASDGAGTVNTTTPTGHRYSSPSPPPPWRPWGSGDADVGNEPEDADGAEDRTEDSPFADDHVDDWDEFADAPGLGDAEGPDEPLLRPDALDRALERLITSLSPVSAAGPQARSDAT